LIATIYYTSNSAKVNSSLPHARRQGGQVVRNTNEQSKDFFLSF
jgi:hypothetical protein